MTKNKHTQTKQTTPGPDILNFNSTVFLDKRSRLYIVTAYACLVLMPTLLLASVNSVSWTQIGS